MAAKPKKASPTWSDVKGKLIEFDRAGLLGMSLKSWPPRRCRYRGFCDHPLSRSTADSRQKPSLSERSALF